MINHRFSSLIQVKYIFISLWLLLLIIVPLSINELLDYCSFLFLGMAGAIFANSTGAGGGVIFIPAFNHLGFTETQAIATSFAIQCFGMTAGAITWYRYYRIEKLSSPSWENFNLIILLCSLCSVIGLWYVYGTVLEAPASLHFNFSWFSFILGISIFAYVLFLKEGEVNSKLLTFDWLALVCISLFGGAITAWLSVGVGELVAIYLIVRRFEVTLAVSVAVVVSAITVWAGVWQHLVIDFQIYWQVLLFAGPGAVVGGILAKTLVNYLSVMRLKLFFAFWLVLIGFVGIV